MEILKQWFLRHLSNPQVVILFASLLLGFGVIVGMGHMLAPALTALVLAYLLEGLTQRLERIGMQRMPAVLLVFGLFMTVLLLLVFGVIPLLSRQITQLVAQLPNYLAKGQALLLQLPERYPDFITEEQITTLLGKLSNEMAAWGQKLLTTSLASLGTLLALVIYLVLVPLLVFFFLKDKRKLLAWFNRLLPKDHSLVSHIWQEVDQQIGNYVRGKVLEIFIVGAVAMVTFTFFGLQYALLLSVVVGLSVLIPYVGATLATVPVVLVAFFQWGWGEQLAYVFIAYLVLQALDGNVLVPLLFSEVVNLHPVAIILAILVFGGFWGVWGVFFAIPLATLIQAILRAWPDAEDFSSDAATSKQSS